MTRIRVGTAANRAFTPVFDGLWPALPPSKNLRRYDSIRACNSERGGAVRLDSIAKVIRSKNAGPCLLTLDVMLPDTAAATAFALIQTIIELGLWFALFGWLPLPPLAGGHLLVAIAPKLRERLPGVQLFLGLILAALVDMGVVTRVLDPAFRFLFSLVTGEAAGI